MFNTVARVSNLPLQRCLRSIEAQPRQCLRLRHPHKIDTSPPKQQIRQLTSSSSSHASQPTPSIAISHFKHPTRGGQNLSKRYERLARSVRGKEEYARLREENASLEASSGESANVAKSSRIAKKQPLMFRGFVIPEEPMEPGSDECCMSGCAFCVYDLYNESLEEYDSAMSHLRVSLMVAGVPKDEWPEVVRESDTVASTNVAESKQKRANPVMSAFKAMERELEERKQRGREGRDEQQRTARTALGGEAESRRASNSKRKVSSIDPGAVVEALSWVVFSKR